MPNAGALAVREDIAPSPVFKNAYSELQHRSN